jgi:phosphatidylinositol alpha-1,6-mannosyltransferase
MRAPDTGLVVSCDSPQPLVQVVTQLLHRPERIAAMGEAGRAWVVENFDWNVLAARAAWLFDIGSPSSSDRLRRDYEDVSVVRTIGS